MKTLYNAHGVVVEGIKQIFIQVGIERRLAGILTQTGSFLTRRTGNEFFRKYAGFGISEQAIEKVRKFKKDIWDIPEDEDIKIVIYYKRKDGNIDVYVAYWSDFLKHGKEYVFAEDDKQRVLSIHKMKKLREIILKR